MQNILYLRQLYKEGILTIDECLSAIYTYYQSLTIEDMMKNMIIAIVANIIITIMEREL